MAEPRRLQFTTIPMSSKIESRSEPPVTVRLKVVLTNGKCTEVSYTDLIRNNNVATSDVPARDDQDVLDTVRALEAKYSSKGGKKRQMRIQDLVDLGEGYDENDTFIDNSEAYDEIVPDCLTTRHDGFYMNRGVLDFREIIDRDSLDATFGSHKKKARRLASDSDSSDDFIKKSGREKKVKDVLEKSRKRLMNKHNRDGSKTKLKKKRALITSLLSSLEQQAKGNSEKMDVSLCDTHLLTSTPVPPAVHSLQDKDAQENRTTTAEVDDAADDHIMNQPLAKLKNECSTTPPVPKLPENLSSDLLENIASIKQAATQSQNGKLKFFTNNVNSLLLSIVTQLDGMRLVERNAVYAHLAAFLPCNKETLVRRAKHLQIAELTNRVNDLTQKLSDAIKLEMPGQIEQNNLRESRSIESKDLMPSPSTDDTNKESSDKISVSDRISVHHMTFQWTPQIRQLLCEIVSSQLKCHDLQKIRAQTPKDYLNAFLDSTIEPLWPPDWMQRRILLKESWSVHHPYTNPPKKKSTLIGRPPGSSCSSLVDGKRTIKKAVTTSENSTQRSVISSTNVSIGLHSGSVARSSASLSSSAASGLNKSNDRVIEVQMQNKPAKLNNSIVNTPITNSHSELNLADVKKLAHCGETRENVKITYQAGPKVNSTKKESQFTLPPCRKDNRCVKEIDKISSSASFDGSDAFLAQFRKFSESLSATSSPLDSVSITNQMLFQPPHFPLESMKSIPQTTQQPVTYYHSVTSQSASKKIAEKVPRLKSLLYQDYSNKAISPNINSSINCEVGTNYDPTNKVTAIDFLTKIDEEHANVLRDVEYLGSISLSEGIKSQPIQKVRDLSSSTDKSRISAKYSKSLSSRTSDLHAQSRFLPRPALYDAVSQPIMAFPSLKNFSPPKLVQQAPLLKRPSPKSFSTQSMSLPTSRQYSSPFPVLGQSSSTCIPSPRNLQEWNSDYGIPVPILQRPPAKCLVTPCLSASIPTMSISDVSRNLVHHPSASCVHQSPPGVHVHQSPPGAHVHPSPPGSHIRSAPLSPYASLDGQINISNLRMPFTQYQPYSTCIFPPAPPAHSYQSHNADHLHHNTAHSSPEVKSSSDK